MNHPMETKADLAYYLACDRAALDKAALKPNRKFGERIWPFEVLLRHTEFWWAKRHQGLSAKLHYFIISGILIAKASAMAWKFR